MSIDFCVSRKDIPFTELLPRLAPYGITLSPSADRDERMMFLTDNKNGGIWVYASEDGMLCALTCYASNGQPGHVLGAIRQAFDTQIAVSDGYKIEVDLAGNPWRTG
jgi:hypothetical protein